MTERTISNDVGVAALNDIFTKDQSVNYLFTEVFVEQPLPLHGGPWGAFRGLHGSMGSLLMTPVVLLIVQDHFHFC